MRFETFVALRYLLSRERSGLLSIITLIAVGGVSVGVTALIIVISVMDGFDHDLIRKMMGIYSHVQIRETDGAIEDYRELIAQLKTHPDVLGAAPVINQQALLQKDTGINAFKAGVGIYGIDPRQESTVTRIQENMLEGSVPAAPREVMLGKVLARKLGVGAGDSIYAVTRLVRTPNGPMPKTPRLRVSGIFESGFYEIDANLAYVTLETAQAIYLTGDVANIVHLKIRDPFRVVAFQESLREYLLPFLLRGKVYTAQGWHEISPDFFKALKLEKIGMFIVLTLIIIVAAFNIIGTLILIVIEKTRQIGILRAVGCGPRHVLLIFFLQGLMIGMGGALLGLALGLCGCYAIEHWSHHVFEIPAAVYGIEKIPVRISAPTIATILVTALVITVLASILPAVKACRLRTVEALRYE